MIEKNSRQKAVIGSAYRILSLLYKQKKASNICYHDASINPRLTRYDIFFSSLHSSLVATTTVIISLSYPHNNSNLLHTLLTVTPFE